MSKEGYVDIEKKKRENMKKWIRGDRNRVDENKRKIYEGKQLIGSAKGDSPSLDDKYKY
ncbi:MAG: hypothetical protein AAB366_00565 [Patescibacteria group bacterium]